MKLYLAVIATAAMIGTALPACAEEIGVGVGPVGVTVGEGHRDRDRDVVRERDVVRDRDRRDHDTVIIKKGDHDRDIDHDRRKVIIDHD
jgi:Ni/Co efflux regulator RcnB